MICDAFAHVARRAPGGPSQRQSLGADAGPAAPLGAALDRYASDIDRHIVPAIGRYRLDKLRPAHLVALYNAKADEGLSGASLRHMHAVIRRALNVAVRWQVIAVNPATLVDTPKAAQHEITPLTAAEARRLIQAAEGDRMQARWLVGLALGLRKVKRSACGGRMWIWMPGYCVSAGPCSGAEVVA